ncbi:hypothetical protein RJ639_046662 [Escallonia herrerae]|uniref:Uncharacterized protein n=1 Tax=Escallonia herrerae TaxID=1293975 RepID=A0AA88W8A8_9ASTE|nr:hypothetical protein RJ639_046662 [Escallonia herrerae]
MKELSKTQGYQAIFTMSRKAILQITARKIAHYGIDPLQPVLLLVQERGIQFDLMHQALRCLKLSERRTISHIDGITNQGKPSLSRKFLVKVEGKPIGPIASSVAQVATNFQERGTTVRKWNTAVDFKWVWFPQSKG